VIEEGAGGGQQQTLLAQAFDQGLRSALRLALQLQPVQLRQRRCQPRRARGGQEKPRQPGRGVAAASQLIAVRQQQQGPAAKGDPPPAASQQRRQLVLACASSALPCITVATGPQPSSQQQPSAAARFRLLIQARPQKLPQRHSPARREQVGLQGAAANAQGRFTASRWMVDGANQPWCWSRERNPPAHWLQHAAFN
jgi:hypothetical protein